MSTPPPPNVVEPFTNLGLVEWPVTNYEPVVSNSAAAPTLSMPSNSFDVFAKGAASSVPITKPNSYAAPVVEGNNSSASTSTKVTAIPQGNSLSPSEFITKMETRTSDTISGNNSSASNSSAPAAASAQKEQMTERDHFMIKKLEEIMEKRFSIPKDKKVPFPEGLTELAATLVMRILKHDTTITNKERADLQNTYLFLWVVESLQVAITPLLLLHLQFLFQ